MIWNDIREDKIREDIPSKQFTKHNLSENIEGIFVEINLRKVNLRKVQWFLFRTYHPSWKQAKDFLKQVHYALDTSIQIYNKLILAGDFTFDETESISSECLYKNHSKNLIWQKKLLWKP